MSQPIYGGLITPHWNQIDAIHYGAAKELGSNELIKKILIGRYVLVKYLEDITYTQDDRNKILLGTLSDPNAEEWYKCYQEDNNIDCDGVVYIKTENGFSPVARLNTSFSEQFVRDAIGLEKDASGSYPSAKSYTDAVDHKVNTLIGEDVGTSVRAIAKEEVSKIVNGAPDSLDTLEEIAGWIENDETGAAALANRVAQAELDIEANENDITAMQTQIDNLVYSIVVEANALPDVNMVATNSIYSIPVDKEEYRALYNIVELSTGKAWNFLGYTEQSQLRWETF